MNRIEQPLGSKRRLYSFSGSILSICLLLLLSSATVSPGREGSPIMEIYVFFFVVTIVAGVINALAGGGGLLTFTLLTLVLPPVAADATSAVALLAAYPTAVWRTRAELTEVPRRWIWLLLIPSLLGGLLGALLLSWSGERNFVVLVPWLVLVAPPCKSYCDLSWFLKAAQISASLTSQQCCRLWRWYRCLWWRSTAATSEPGLVS